MPPRLCGFARLELPVNQDVPYPPRLAEWLLRRFAPPGIAGLSIVGDAREEYVEHRRDASRLVADL